MVLSATVGQDGSSGLTAEAFFAEADALPFTDLPSLIGDGGLLVVAPHPDDESLGCGGLLALSAQAGRALHVVVVSDGTGSHPNSRRFPAPALRSLREQEAAAAVAALGLRADQITFLRLHDRFVPARGPEADGAVAKLAEAARAVGASTVAVTWRHDPHCDHQACFALAECAAAATGARLIEYPVWGHTLPPDTRLASGPIGSRLDVTDALPAKCAAIAAHRSQMTGMIDDDPHGFALPPAMIARFQRPFEIYLHGSAAEPHALS